MTTSFAPAEPAAPRQAFTFYAADGRIYVSNGDQKLIDLGELTEKDGRFAYVLDGNQQAAEGLASPSAALRHIADHVRYLFLDGQFTALADLREDRTPVHLDGAARIDVMMDVLPRAEPMEDATV